MRNRILVILLVVSVLTLMAGSAFADGLVRAPERRTSIYTRVNDAGTLADGDSTEAPSSTHDTYRDTLVPAGTITPDDRILGFIVVAVPDSDGKYAGAQVGFYDTSSATTTTVASMITEAEVGVENGAEPMVVVLFPYPVNVTNQLVISQRGMSIVSILYEDVSAY